VHRPARLSLSVFSRSGVVLAVGLVTIGVTVVACSGVDTGDPTPTQPPAASTATPNQEPPPATATPTNTPEPTPTSTLPPTATAEPTATATNTPTPSPTPTTEPTPSPTASPTPAPLPTGGAELRIVGKAIEMIVPGDAEGSVLYAITNAGISVSRDGGATWVASGDVQEGVMVAALNNPDVLYAGDFGACARGGSDTPLVRSTDGGNTWQTFPAGRGIQPLLIEAGQSSTVVGSSCLLQFSADGGQSWMPIPGDPNFDAYATASSQPDRLDDAMIVLGISEGGTSRAMLFNLSGDEPEYVGSIAEFYALGAVAWTDGRIVLATSTGVGVSDDGGATWTWSRAGLERATYSVDPLQEPIPNDEQGRSYGFSSVTIDPNDPNRIWIAGANGAFWSSDGGRIWTQIGDNSAIDSLVVSFAAERVYISSDGGTRVWTLEGR
jgi:photosystem II stability/assembly factor-like uncharacterized protein